MKSIILYMIACLALPTICSSQVKDVTREVKKGSFFAYISPISTEQGLKEMEATMLEDGYDVGLSEFQWSEDGLLKSFRAKLISHCGEEFTYDHRTDFQDEKNFPLGVLFISEDCSAGLFTTTFSGLSRMFDIFFGTSNPQNLYFSWSGDLNLAEKELLAALWD